MLSHVAKTLFVGVLNDCFFEPATALCLNGKTEPPPGAGPVSPDRCPNSCITNRHRPMWAKAIADGEALLKDEPAVTAAARGNLRRHQALQGCSSQIVNMDDSNWLPPTRILAIIFLSEYGFDPLLPQIFFLLSSDAPERLDCDRRNTYLLLLCMRTQIYSCCYGV